MAIAFTQTYRLPEFRTIRVIGTLAFTGSYVSGGEVVSGILKPGTTKNVIFWGHNNKGIYTVKYDPATGKVAVYSGGTELTAGAYPAGLSSDVHTLELEFPKA